MARGPSPHSVGFVVGAVLSTWGFPLIAHAWTEASVRTVSARVRIDGQANTQVDLSLIVGVDGGWLSGLELAGFEPGLELDPEAPATAHGEHGEAYSVRARARSGGRISLTFPGRSVRRGRVQIDLRYRASLPRSAVRPSSADDSVAVRWTLPAWRSGLDRVRVEIRAPTGSRFSPLGQDAEARFVRRRTSTEGDQAILLSTRPHLPRTLSWPIDIQIPALAMDASLRGVAPRQSAEASPDQAPGGEEQPSEASPYARLVFAGLALVCGVLAILSLARGRRLERLTGHRSRGWIPLPDWVRAMIALAGCTATAVAGSERPWIAIGTAALACLATARAQPLSPPAAGRGSFRAADPRWQRAARRRLRERVHPSAFADGHEPAGWVALALIALGAVLAVWSAETPPYLALAMGLVPLPIFTGAGRRDYPLSAREQLGLVLSACSKLASLPEGFRLRPVVHCTEAGRVDSSRVRIDPARPPWGGELELIAHRGERGREVWLRAMARVDSDVDQALSDLAWDRRVPSPSGRVTNYYLRFDAPKVEELLLALAQAIPSPRNRGPVPRLPRSGPHETTVREAPPPAAVGF